MTEPVTYTCKRCKDPKIPGLFPSAAVRKAIAAGKTHNLLCSKCISAQDGHTFGNRQRAKNQPARTHLLYGSALTD